MLSAADRAHLAQALPALRKIYPKLLINEGIGEFLRWLVSVYEGWLTPQEAAGELDDALAACMLIADDRRNLASRVRQLLGGTTWAENPRSRTRRLVTNIGDRLPHLPRDRDHRLSRQWRGARTCAGNGGAREPAHDKAL